MSGVVSDETDAAVPDAHVTIRNVGNALKRETTTDRRGLFVFTFLPPGLYQLSAEHDGFTTNEIRNVLLNVDDQRSIDVRLKVAGLGEAVTVLAEPSRISTAPSVGAVVGRQLIANMPLNGRSLQALLQLVPGVVLTQASGKGGTGATQFSVNGQRTTANNFTVDGVSANTGMNVSGSDYPGAAGSGQAAGTTVLGSTASLASLDAVQEFRIETSTFAAEFGRAPGGQVSLVTRSGTNVFHGSASEYFRHDVMDANDWFANRLGKPKAEERQHLFSGVLGGPLRRERLFFFVSHEQLRLHQPKTAIIAVPTQELRASLPTTAQPYLDAVPLPNGPSLDATSAQFGATYSDPSSFDVSALRLDGQMSSALSGFARVNHAPSQARTRVYSLSTTQSTEARNDAVTAGVTWIVKERTSAELRFNVTRNAPLNRYLLDTFGGAVVPSAADVFAPGADPSSGFLRFSAIGPGFVWGSGNRDAQRQLNIVGTVASLVRSHQFKLGVDYRRLQPSLAGLPHSETLSFNGAQDLLENRGSYGISIAAQDPREALFSTVSLYAQDTWRTSRRVTVTFGVRFERVPPPTEASGRNPPAILGIEADAIANPQLAPSGTPLWKDRPGDLAPRAGIAYQLSSRSGWETSLRGGAGVFYDLGFGQIANAFQNAYPFFSLKNISPVGFPLRDSDRTFPELGVGAPGTLWVVDPNLRLPYTIQWNGALEQTLGSGQVVTATYVGAAGRRLIATDLYSQPLAEFPNQRTLFVVQRNRGLSRYDALQTQYQCRMYRGVHAIVSYTLGRAEDNESADDAAPGLSKGNTLRNELQPSNFDVRHTFSTALTANWPTPKGPAFLRILGAGWGTDLLVRAQSAPPADPSAGFVFVDRFATFYAQRPDLVAGQPLYLFDSALPGGRRFNQAAFVSPSAGQQGNFPRNGLRGFSASQVDMSIRRDFRLGGGGIRVQIKGAVFNVLNHPNFGQPNTSRQDPLFGQPTQMLNSSLGGLNALYQMGGPRSGELMLRLEF